MNALILNGQVIQIESETFPVNSALEWVSIPTGETVEVGYGYAGGTFTAPAAPPPPTLLQQAQAALSGGITITSTGTSSLDGIYSVDATAQSNLQAVQTYILTNGKFPGSSGTYPWLDMAGAAHTFPSTTEFEAFATAIADYVADLTLIALTGTGTIPTPTATIP